MALLVGMESAMLSLIADIDGGAPTTLAPADSSCSEDVTLSI
jgi:hypothetical protein